MDLSSSVAFRSAKERKTKRYFRGAKGDYVQQADHLHSVSFSAKLERHHGGESSS